MKTFLVYLSATLTELVTKDGLTFEPQKPYRCCLEEDEDPKGALIWGEWFTLKDYNKLFEPVIDRIHREWTEMELIVDGKPCTKKHFKEVLDCHKYGKGKKAFYSGFISKNHPKELCFQFTTPFIEPKSVFIGEAYENFVKVVEGNWEPIDNKRIIRGNSGIPLGYGEIRWR